MFGYVICNKASLEKEEWERYQAYYCGLCHVLKDQFGQLERWTLSYDMTFLTILLSALYEPDETQSSGKCVLHPLRKKGCIIKNEYASYAAHMSIALSFYKCKDDWEDEHKRSSQMFGKALVKAYASTREKYPVQCEGIEKSLSELNRLEKQEGADPRQIIDLSGQMFSEVFVCREDFWSDTLRRFGFEMGRFIYLMDAVMDYEKDRKKQNYNPLLVMNMTPEEAEPALRGYISRAAAEFERLPIVQDANLLRNIIYGGVWQKYYAMKNKKEKRNGTGSL